MDILGTITSVTGVKQEDSCNGYNGYNNGCNGYNNSCNGYNEEATRGLKK